jgi:hypothetical protein
MSGSIDAGRATAPAPPARSAGDTTADSAPASGGPAATGSTPPARPGGAPASAGARPEAMPNTSSTARAPDPGATIPPGRYQAERVALDLRDGGAFEMTGGDGQKIAGRYEVRDGMLVLTGDGGAPIRCRIDRSGTVIRLLNADDGACRGLHGTQLRGQG